MAAESIGSLVPTKIPGLSDQADIQAALRVYHYGSYTFDTAETDPAELINPSIAYTINDLQDQIDSISGGSAIQATSFNAKGDLLSASANDTLSVLTVGSNGRVLTANSSTATGLEWATPEVTATSTTTLTSKTLTSPTVNNSLDNYPTIKSPTETTNIVASAATGTININSETSTVWYYTTNASANHTLNFRYSSSATLDSVLSVGESVTIIWMNTNGTTPYYPNVIQIDGSTVTPKWSGGTAPSAGNASSIDVYAFNILKTASATFVVLGSQSRFA
jgi:uncharacterized protein YaiE (UPF0345 family)